MKGDRFSATFVSFQNERTFLEYYIALNSLRQENSPLTIPMPISSTGSEGYPASVSDSWIGNLNVSDCSLRCNDGVQDKRDMVCCFGQKEKT